MKNRILIVGFLFLGGGSWVFSQKTNEIPVFKSDSEKADWIKEHPDLYRELGGASNTESAILNQELNSNSNPWENDVEKANWLKEHPEEYQRMISDAAVSQDNGLPWKRDELKAQWVKDHPEEAKRMNIIQELPVVENIAVQAVPPSDDQIHEDVIDHASSSSVSAVTVMPEEKRSSDSVIETKDSSKPVKNKNP